MPRHQKVSLISSRSFSVSNSLEKNDHVIDKTWNLKGLKQEVGRRKLRAFKKVEKAHEKLRILRQLEGSEPESDDVPERLTVEQAMLDLQTHQEQLECLNDLDENLQCVKSTGDPFFKAMLPDIVRLEISDAPPARPAPVPRVKPSKEPAAPRLPYHTYESIDGIEIRVGRGAEDNDELSCNPEHRDGGDWWMHVAGMPGSHVVIRSTAENLPATHKNTILDAALLTAIHSKATGGRVQVTLTRCRNVSKPAGAKAGLVQLRGDMQTITVDVKGESKRLERLKRIK
jgi:predicted ribosome quality control (RQC) complex YloA/Tae2 family protein